MKQLFKRGAAIGVGLTVGIVIAEIVSGMFLRLAAPAGVPGGGMDAVYSGAGEEKFTATAPKTELHPYVGFALNPTLNPESNRLGFLGPDPTSPKPVDVIRIGITGASVAEFLYSYRDIIVRDLEKRPSFKSKKIEIVSFALRGYKQPQQFMALSYLLTMDAKLDVVVNLDGFTDIALPWAENSKDNDPIQYPRMWHLFARKAVSPKEALILGRMAELEGIRRRIERIRTKFPWKISRTVQFAGTLLDRKLSGAIMRRQLALSGPAERSTVRRDKQEVLQKSAEIWKQSSLQMSRLCAANGIAYIHVLIPNQYVEGSRVLTPEETRPRFDDSAIEEWQHDIEEAVKTGYPLLLREGAELKKSGVNFFDLTGIFRDEPKTVYADYCCHYNELGNGILADRVAEIIAGCVRSRVGK